MLRAPTIAEKHFVFLCMLELLKRIIKVKEIFNVCIILDIIQNHKNAFSALLPICGTITKFICVPL